MAAVAPSQDAQPPQPPSSRPPRAPAQPAQAAPHGTKRAADSSLENEQRLSKRFDLLNLVEGSGARLYIPVPGSSDAVPPSRHAAEPIAPKPLHAPPSPKPSSHQRRQRRTPQPAPDDDDDCMQVEDTPHRVFIHDLDAELSDIESDEENPIFLSDIEKHLSKIPRHVLLGGPEPAPTKDNQLVLYNVPSSLTVPEELDTVRKAIVEARARAREKQACPTAERAGGTLGGADVGLGAQGVSEIGMGEEDGDAMEIDG